MHQQSISGQRRHGCKCKRNDALESVGCSAGRVSAIPIMQASAKQTTCQQSAITSIIARGLPTRARRLSQMLLHRTARHSRPFMRHWEAATTALASPSKCTISKGQCRSLGMFRQHSRDSSKRHDPIQPAASVQEGNVTCPNLLSILTQSSQMSAAGKIVRSANAPRTPPSDIELQVGTALLELENSVADLKAELRPLQISSAQEIDVNGGRKAVVMWVFRDMDCQV